MSDSNENAILQVFKAKLATPLQARRESGTYWGYTVRISRGLSNLFSGCPYPVRALFW